jgi:hypothetical protein
VPPEDELDTPEEAALLAADPLPPVDAVALPPPEDPELADLFEVAAPLEERLCPGSPETGMGSPADCRQPTKQTSNSASEVRIEHP